MNSTRLFILGSLAKDGPMHGHQIRRAAQVDRTELWADVKPGSLYGALHRMETEGVVVALRTEQEGNRPARTVYAITDGGRAELEAQRDEALRAARLRPDPVDLALQFAGGLEQDELRGVIAERRTAIMADLAAWRRLRASAEPYLTEVERIAFRHTLLRLEVEVAWHEELLEHIPHLFAVAVASLEDQT